MHLKVPEHPRLAKDLCETLASAQAFILACVISQAMDDLDVVPPSQSVRVTLTLTPEELELALATGCESLRERLLLALIAKLAVDSGQAKRLGRRAST